VAIILLAYFSLYEIDHHAGKIIIIILMGLTAISIFILFRLYFKYMKKPVEPGSLDTKKRQ
jgi:hypothetical protein